MSINKTEINQVSTPNLPQPGAGYPNKVNPEEFTTASTRTIKALERDLIIEDSSPRVGVEASVKGNAPALPVPANGIVALPQAASGSVNQKGNPWVGTNLLVEMLIALYSFFKDLLKQQDLEGKLRTKYMKRTMDLGESQKDTLKDKAKNELMKGIASAIVQGLGGVITAGITAAHVVGSNKMDSDIAADKTLHEEAGQKYGQELAGLTRPKANLEPLERARNQKLDEIRGLEAIKAREESETAQARQLVTQKTQEKAELERQRDEKAQAEQAKDDEIAQKQAAIDAKQQEVNGLNPLDENYEHETAVLDELRGDKTRLEEAKGVLVEQKNDFINNQIPGKEREITDAQMAQATKDGEVLRIDGELRQKNAALQTHEVQWRTAKQDLADQERSVKTAKGDMDRHKAAIDEKKEPHNRTQQRLQMGEQLNRQAVEALSQLLSGVMTNKITLNDADNAVLSTSGDVNRTAQGGSDDTRSKLREMSEGIINSIQQIISKQLQYFSMSSRG